MASESIAILHHMARSGGTLISKCIGCMEGVSLLSEVHPFTASGQFNPITQAEQWFGMNMKKELMKRGRPDGMTWVEVIAMIKDYAAGQGNQLVLRDWSHLDYIGVPWVEAKYQQTAANLLSERYEVKRFFTVRHPIDQWFSLTKLGVIQGKLSVPAYLKGYRIMAEHAAEVGFLRYEDFTQEPDQSLQTICAALQIVFDPTYAQKWPDFTAITGDVATGGGGGRATHEREIKPLERKQPPAELLTQFEASQDYRRSLELMGYD